MSQRAQRGFSLLEVLVAFSILAMSLSTILALFGTGLRSTVLARDYQQALLVADTRLAVLQGIAPRQLQPEVAHGEVPGGFTWKSEVRAIEQEPPAVGGIAVYQLAVAVSWNDAGKSRQIELTSLRLGTLP